MLCHVMLKLAMMMIWYKFHAFLYDVFVHYNTLAQKAYIIEKDNNSTFSYYFLSLKNIFIFYFCDLSRIKTVELLLSPGLRVQNTWLRLLQAEKYYYLLFSKSWSRSIYICCAYKFRKCWLHFFLSSVCWH